MSVKGLTSGVESGVNATSILSNIGISHHDNVGSRTSQVCDSNSNLIRKKKKEKKREKTMCVS